ncbi:MAG: tol-pal system protein YbgF [Chlorobiaceae bacterium]|jgi:tol-pal system protein YbgF|nr:tol-pal system protein YbgF [Chlorobiaceae bacterium]
MHIRNAVLFLCPLLMLNACASKSELVVVADDVKRLKTDTETVRSQSAASYSDVQLVRDEVAQLKGNLDEMAYQNKQTFGRLGLEDSLIVHKLDAIETRLSRIEQQLGSGSAKTSSQAAASSGVSSQPVVVQTAKALLGDGIQKLESGSYAAAREIFALLMQSHPSSDLVDDAQFYIAESYFSEKWYEKAVLEYQTVIAKYTKSNKRPAALYKQALAFEQLGDAVNAKARFRDVMNVYPFSPEAALAKKKML